MRNILLTTCLLVIFQFQTLAQEPDSLVNDNRVFTLGEVTVFGSVISDSINSLSFQKMEKFNRVDVSHALNTLSGVTLANVGPRNESVVYVRGFDLRQVPVFMDGVPVYVPYDGYVDMGRFTTFDLAEVSVSKGFSSILFGANTMGGAINLISRRPVEKIEVSGRAGAFSGEGINWNINAGSRMDRFYFQAGVSQLKQDSYPLSDDFRPRKFEDGDERENSYRDDKKFSLKVGFTPKGSDEYVIGFSSQHGEKGNPPYVGNDPAIQTRFWQWPTWDKQSLYFISNTALSAKYKVKTRLYYDTFVNELVSYDDSTYTTISRPYAFRSYYDDYTVGGNVEFQMALLPKNMTKVNVQLKHDVHRENNLGEPQRTFADNTLSIGLEDTYQVSANFSVIPGVSYNMRKSLEAQDYIASSQEITDFPSNQNEAVNVQVGMFWDLNENHSIQGTIARKTRFATIKDRYSYRMGQAIPNPDLTAEVSVNYDLSYTGRWFTNFTIQSSVFRSDISDIIQRIDNVQPNRFQLQNAGDALFYGAEFSVNYSFAKSVNVGANYSYIRRKNETNPEIRFANVPDHKLFGFIDVTVLKRINVMSSVEYDSKRYSTSYGTYADGYTLVNGKVSAKVIKYLSIEGGINNIFDENYSLVEGFPEAGRNYYVNLVFQTF